MSGKSRVSEELENLRQKGLAKTGRGKFKDTGTFRTPEEAEAFLREVQSAKKKQDKPVPPTNLNSSDLNDWYSKQRQFELEQRKRREEAENLLRSYRSTSVFDKNIPVSPKDHVEDRIAVVDEENTVTVACQIGKFEKEGEDEEINDDVTGKLENNHVLADNDDLERVEKEETSMTEENNDIVDDMSSESPDDGSNDKKDVPSDQEFNKVEEDITNDSNDILDDDKPLEANANEIEVNGDETEHKCDSSDDNDDGVKDNGDQDISKDEADGSIDVEDVNINEGILGEIESSCDTNDGDIKLNAEEADLIKESTKEVDLYSSEPSDEIQAETEEADDDLNANEQSRSMNESDVQENAVMIEDVVENEKQVKTEEDVDLILEAVDEISLDDQELTTESTPNQSSEEEKKDDCDDDNMKLASVEDGWRFLISREPGAKFAPEPDRYHIYSSFACPWGHRVTMTLNLKGLQNVIGVTHCHPTWQFTKPDVDDHRGWVFGSADGEDLSNTAGMGKFPSNWGEEDPINGAKTIRDLYEKAGDQTGKYILPVLWDKKHDTIVSNESSEIIRMLNSEFNEFAEKSSLDLYPDHLRNEIDSINGWIYPYFNNGVYRCGLASTQERYDIAIDDLTKAFDKIESILQKKRFLCGESITEADVRLFVTLLRFDEVYDTYFKCNTRSVRSTPVILNYVRDIYQIDGVKETCSMEMIKAHYYTSHVELNKYSIIPRGDNFLTLLDQPHNRDKIGL